MIISSKTVFILSDQEPYRWENVPQSSSSDQASTSGIERPATSLDARTGAAIAAVQEKVLMFGGYDPTTGAGFNDVAAFDLRECIVSILALPLRLRAKSFEVAPFGTEDVCQSRLQGTVPLPW